MAYVMEREKHWSLLPEDLLIAVSSYFPYNEIIKIGLTCKRWHNICTGNNLWKTVFCRDFQISLKTEINPLGKSWVEEYKRLIDDTPNVLSDELSQRNEVLHVTFSNSGKLIATCCKDSNLIVSNINNEGTTSPRYSTNMHQHGWQYTWASQFNSSDSLLMVSGGLWSGIKGAIAIFETTDVGDYVMLCKVKNDPHDANVAWFNERTWLSAELTKDLTQPQPQLEQDTTVYMCRTYPGQEYSEEVDNVDKNIVFKNRRHIMYNRKYLRRFLVSNRKHFKEDTIFATDGDFEADSQPIAFENQEADEEWKTVLQDNKFCLIFLRSGQISVPHQIGFKMLHPEHLSSVPAVETPEKLIEMHGYILGMAQDKEGRFLYVNVRKWTESGRPAIAIDIETRVIDLKDLSVTDQVYKGHKGYTDEEDAFYIYVNVGTMFVGSGSEDGFAYIWDKLYGCQVAANKHDDIVSCVAFSPTDTSVAVSCGDDHKVKVWISRRKARSLQRKTFPPLK